MSRKILHEAGTLSPAKSDGTYRVCLITEGVGSSATYPRELFTQENADAFSSALSFMNHPLDPERPHMRSAEDIVGQVGSKIDVEEHDGLLGFWAPYKPRESDPNKAAFIKEYAHALGLSVYIMANGRIEMVKESDSDDETGVETFITESFDGTDPYKSVDIVVAAGRGGHFARAQEAYRRFESSAVIPVVPNPDATSAQDTKEGQMDKEILEAINSLKDAVSAIATSSTTTAEAEAQAKADAAAVEAGVEDRVAKYEEAVEAIEAAELLPSQATAIKAEARKGTDVTALIESAKAIALEAKTVFENQDEDADTAGGRIVESAGAATRTAESVIPGGWA